MRAGSYFQAPATAKTSHYYSLPSPTMPRPFAAPSPSSSRQGGYGTSGAGRGISGFRRRYVRHILHPRTLIIASLLSLGLVAYFTSYTSSLSFTELLWRPFGPETPRTNHVTTQPPKTSKEIDLAEILYSDDLAQMSLHPRKVIYVWCDTDTSFTYVNYVSLASVIRFYGPERIFLLYERNPPTIDGDWIPNVSTLVDYADPDRLGALLKRCKAYKGPTRMRDASLVCGTGSQNQQGSVTVPSTTPNRLDDFITKLLLHYGGLYVGRNTLLTEVANYFNIPGAISDHILSFHSWSRPGEGFTLVRDAVFANPSTTTPPPGQVQQGMDSGSMKTERPPGLPDGVEVRYYKSREIGCYEGRNFSTDALHLIINNRQSLFACAVMASDRNDVINPQNVLSLKSDFGRVARKALFNIHDDWETKYYLKAVNGSAVPPMCFF